MRFLCNVNITRTALTLRQIFLTNSRIAAKVGYFTEQYKYVRKFSTTYNKLCHSDVDEKSLKNMMDQLGDKFSVARELLQDARESQETVYFSEDLQEAEEAVSEAIEEYGQLLNKLNEAQRSQVVRSIGLRMEELKAQRQAIEDSLKE